MATFDLQGALAAGHSMADVAQFLSQQNKFDYAGARKSGFSDQEIAQELMGRMNPQQAASVAPNPQVPFQQAPVQAYQPVKPTGNYGGVAVGPFGAGTMPNAYSPGQLQAAQQGVNVDANADVGTARANFQATQEKRDAIVAQEIKTKYGPNTPTRSGPDGLEWYNAKADGGRGQWQSAGDSFGGAAVNAIPATGEAIGSTVGGLLPWETIGMAGGDAAGRFTGDLLKNAVGTAMYPQDVKDFPSLKQMGEDAAEHGAMALAGGAAVAGIPAGFRMAFRGQDILKTPGAIRSVLQDYWSNLPKVQQMNAALVAAGKNPLKMSVFRIASMTDNPTDIQNSYALNAVDKEQVLAARSDSAAARLQSNSQYNQHAVEDYYLSQNHDPYNYNNLTQQNWQANLRRIWQNYKDGMLGPAQQDADNAVQQAIAAAKQNPSFGQLDTNKLSQIVQNALVNKMKASKALKDNDWASYESLAGYTPNKVASSIKVPLTPEYEATRQKFINLSKSGMLPQQRAQGARYITRVPGDEEEAQPDLSPLEQALRNMESGTNDDTKTVDLAMLDRTIKDLRLEYRRNANNTVTDDMSDENRNSLLGTLVNMRQQWMDQPENAEINAALHKAEASTATHAQTFKQGFAADFLNRDTSGHIGVADPTLLHTFLTSGRRGVPDIEGARQLATLVNGDPQAHSAILDYAHALYNEDYTDILGEDAGKNAGDRILSPTKHTLWNEQVMPTLDPFLSADERKQFRQLGGLSKGVAIAKAKLQKAQETWNNLDSGKIGQRLQNETFVNNFFDKNKSFADQNLGFIKYRLDGIGTGNTNALDTTRAGIVQAMGDKVRTNGILDPNKLFNVYTPLRDRFQAYFGKQYTAAMDRILPTLKALQNNPRWNSKSTFTAAPYEGQSKLGYWVRYGLLGPLSSDNRKLTIMENLRSQSYYSRMERAMYDPNELTKLANDIDRFGFRANRARLGGAIGTAVGIARSPTDRIGSSVPQQKQQGQGFTH